MFWKFLWDCQVEEVVETFHVITNSGGKIAQTVVFQATPETL